MCGKEIEFEEKSIKKYQVDRKKVDILVRHFDGVSQKKKINKFFFFYYGFNSSVELFDLIPLSLKLRHTFVLGRMGLDLEVFLVSPKNEAQFAIATIDQYRPKSRRSTENCNESISLNSARNRSRFSQRIKLIQVYTISAFHALSSTIR